MRVAGSITINGMSILGSIGLFWLLWTGQAEATPAHVVEGDRVEAEFRRHRDDLDRFFISLRTTVARRAPELLPEFRDPPPEPVVYGYGLLPQLVDDFPSENDAPISSFSYSWPITEEYVDGEVQKLQGVEEDFEKVVPTVTRDVIQNFIREYRTLVRNQRTIDGYIQYNRFWQRAIAEDRPRFDQLTTLYDLMISGDRATTNEIQEVLGVPDVPSFVSVEGNLPDDVVIRIPVYTDIGDVTFLRRAENAIENMWRVQEADAIYALDLEFRQLDVSDLYPASDWPEPGDPVDVPGHASRFPEDGAVLTTGAEATHGFVGRYVALGPGDVSARTLAHEFGHVLGFRDGYIRGYRDLGELGFEILELTSAFDDIMSAPREGRVLGTHFRLIMDGVR